MKKTILKVLTYIGALGAWAGACIGELKLTGVIFGDKLSDEYAVEHPYKAGMIGLLGIILFLISGLGAYVGIMKVADWIVNKIDNMKDDNYAKLDEDKEWEQ